MQKIKGTYIERTPLPVPLAITPTFRPWTHTSDDSYIYQLSLAVATATVSFVHAAVRGGTCAFTLKIVNTLIKNSSRDEKPSIST